MCGNVWQWTRSSYDPYPGFRPDAGPAGEYNGKFMVGQLVLRGGSFATPPGHTRTTYRNYFPPGALPIISSATERGTSSYRPKCIEYSARPWVEDRMCVA